MANNKIEVSFKLEDIPMIIETLEKIQNENEEYKQALLDIKALIQHYGNEEKIIDIINEALGDKE